MGGGWGRGVWSWGGLRAARAIARLGVPAPPRGQRVARTCSGLRLALAAGTLLMSGSLPPLMVLAAGARLGGGCLGALFVSFVAGKLTTLPAVLVAGVAAAAGLGEGAAAAGTGLESQGKEETIWDRRFLGGGGARRGGGDAAIVALTPGGEPLGKVSSSETDTLEAIASWKGRTVLSGRLQADGEATWVTTGAPSSCTVSGASEAEAEVAVQVTLGVTDAVAGSTAAKAWPSTAPTCAVLTALQSAW